MPSLQLRLSSLLHGADGGRRAQDATNLMDSYVTLLDMGLLEEHNEKSKTHKQEVFQCAAQHAVAVGMLN